MVRSRRRNHTYWLFISHHSLSTHPYFLEQNFDSTWDERAQLVSDLIKDDESPINWGGSEMFGESKLVQGKNTVKLEFRLRWRQNISPTLSYSPSQVWVAVAVCVKAGQFFATSNNFDDWNSWLSLLCVARCPGRSQTCPEYWIRFRVVNSMSYNLLALTLPRLLLANSAEELHRNQFIVDDGRFVWVGGEEMCQEVPIVPKERLYNSLLFGEIDIPLLWLGVQHK